MQYEYVVIVYDDGDDYDKNDNNDDGDDENDYCVSFVFKFVWFFRMKDRRILLRGLIIDSKRIEWNVCFFVFVLL